MYGYPGLSQLPRPRLLGWSITTALLMLVIWLVAPHQMPVIAYKAALVCFGGVLGYWIDRALFPYARPHKLAHTDPTFDRNARSEERRVGKQWRDGSAPEPPR